MTAQTIVVELLSDATFSLGEPTAGEVDVEIDHDELGLPVLRGKTLHGLLRDAWLSLAPYFAHLDEAAGRVLGLPRDHTEHSVARVGDAVVDDETRQWVSHALGRTACPLRPPDVLRGLTDVRWQTAVDRWSGAPAPGTLRSHRTVLRGLALTSTLDWERPPTSREVAVLALCTLGTRHAGLGRNRGRGHVRLTLDGSLEATVEAARQALPAGARP